MTAEMSILITAAISISFLHTVTGPDHYLPFIALSKARGWTLSRTMMWTLICGCGHVWSSVLLGLGGAAIGWSFSKISWFENIRGGVAGWALMLFGIGYSTWAFIQLKQGKRHKHFDIHGDGSIYVYEHKPGQIVLPKERHKVTPWVMFIIFVLGPCEPMIPLLYFPGATGSLSGIFILISVYTVFTLAAMVFMVLLGFWGSNMFKFEKLEPYMHTISGAAIFICGAGMIEFGW